jgi:hypothetical protein
VEVSPCEADELRDVDVVAGVEDNLHDAVKEPLPEVLEPLLGRLADVFEELYVRLRGRDDEGVPENVLMKSPVSAVPPMKSMTSARPDTAAHE